MSPAHRRKPTFVLGGGNCMRVDGIDGIRARRRVAV